MKNLVAGLLILASLTFGAIDVSVYTQPAQACESEPAVRTLIEGGLYYLPPQNIMHPIHSRCGDYKRWASMRNVQFLGTFTLEEIRRFSNTDNRNVIFFTLPEGNTLTPDGGGGNFLYIIPKAD